MGAKIGLCALAMVFTVRMPAQDREWNDTINRAQRAEDSGNYLEELAHCRRAAAMADHFEKGDARIWITYNFLGIAYQEAGFAAESLHAFRHALPLIKSGLGIESEPYAVALANEATVFNFTGDAESAESKLRQAVEILKRAKDAKPAHLAGTECRLAEVLLDRGHTADAERMIEEALPVLRAESDHIETANALNNLGIVRRWQHRYGEALQLVGTAVSMIEQQYGAHHPLLLRPLNNQAVLYLLVGRMQEADATFRRAEKLCEDGAFPPKHPAYAMLLGNYASFLRQTGEKSRAKAIAAQARSILGDDARRDGLGLTVDVAAFRHP